MMQTDEVCRSRSIIAVLRGVYRELYVAPFRSKWGMLYLRKSSSAVENTGYFAVVIVMLRTHYKDLRGQQD